VVKWIDCKGIPLPAPTLRPNPFVDPWVQDGDQWEARLANLALRDPGYFVSGQLHTNLDNWKLITDLVENKDSRRVYQWIKSGVDVSAFFQHFKGNFQGKALNHDTPPRSTFRNHKSCAQYSTEITAQLEERLRNGSLNLLGKVGEVEPPKLVMPLVMVPGTRKNRLCHDERFLNLFIKGETFSLETLSHT
jgi:hypothetical protein